jgi:dimethylaniline monooxygenase (N-oxide forming)
MRIAVIGAGPSGLVTVKELLEQGHSPTCFERAPDLGGIFRFDEEAGSVWESCRLTSSGLLTGFSDFPVPADEVGQQTVGEYVDYLRRYCRAFGVGPQIRFGANVESVERGPDGEWRLQVRGLDGGTAEERFDSVAVCSGLHQNSRHPRFPGQESFPGRIMHGVEYRRPDQVAGKRVLIVGAGESGADLVAEVSAHAEQTVLALRRGVGVLPRKIRGRPNDWLTCRIGNSSAHWVFQTRNPADDRKRNLYRVVFLPLVLLDKVAQLTTRGVDWFKQMRPLLGLRRSGRAALADARMSLETTRLRKQLLRESGGTIDEQFGTKSDEFVKAIVAGRCRRCGPIARFDGGRVLLEDSEEFEPDLVILCTGFEARVPFLDEGLLRERRYLHTFAPTVGGSLALIGFARPAFGAIPPIAELQARWFAQVASGAAELPAAAAMRESIDRLDRFHRHYFRPVGARLDHLVDFTSLCDQLASEIGCKPTREAIRTESRGFRLRFYAAPFVAAQYRLVGPHAKPGLARDVIAGLPVAHRPHEVGTFYLRWTLSRTLHRLLGPDYAPKLALQ